MSIWRQPGYSKSKPAPLKPSPSALDSISKIMTNDSPRELVPRKRGPKVTLPRMRSVDSSNLKAMQWKDGFLFVRFKDRSVYRYGAETNPVPKAIFEELQQASADEESVGKIFIAKVRDQYPTTKLVEGT